EELTGPPLQRIGLSATVQPAAEAARFLGGFWELGTRNSELGMGSGAEAHAPVPAAGPAAGTEEDAAAPESIPRSEFRVPSSPR
ncbi:MAG: hypothetical protein ABR568_23895, partial [Pyrinomonadaceae bacterium]